MSPQTQLKPIVYLTAELKSRDLDSRLLIAAHLLKMGFAVIVGQQWAIFNNFEHAPRGCYFFKTLNVVQGGAMAQIREAGNLIVGADEEALCAVGDLSLEAVHPSAMAAAHVILAQNETHRDILVKAYPAANVAIGGSARVDLLSMEIARGTRPLADPYILFNTNFPLTNGYVPLSIAAKGVKDIDADVAYEKARLEQLLALIQWSVDNVKGCRIVIRPHPGEQIDPWKQLFAGKDNVLVIGRSDPVEWINGAEIMVHADSTTGMETALMKKPCLNISPAGFDHRAQERLMKQINFTVPTAAEAVAPLVQFLTTRGGPLSRPTGGLDFPPNGALMSALAVAKLLEDHGATPPAKIEKLPWIPTDRMAFQREKFTVTAEEAGQRATRLFHQAGVTSCEFLELDDSIFYFAPK